MGDGSAYRDTKQTAELAASLAPAKHPGCRASALEPDSVQIAKDYFVIVAKFKKKKTNHFYNKKNKSCTNGFELPEHVPLASWFSTAL